MTSKAVPTNYARERAMGNCYEESWKLFEHLVPIFGSANVVLVHGRPVLQRPPHEQYGHAWVEIYDRQCSGTGPLLGRWIRKDVFYEAGQIDAELNQEYTYAEALEHITTHAHFGPWEGVDAVPLKGKRR